MNPEIDFTKSGHVPVYGRNDSGKTTTIKQILQQTETERVAIIDYHDEYGDLISETGNIDRFVVPNKAKASKDDLMDYMEHVLNKIKAVGYDVIVIDEFNQYIKTKHETPFILESLKNNIAHDEWNKALGFYIMRRPAQGDNEFRETALFMIVCYVSGKGNISQLNDISPQLGDLATRLAGSPYYDFIFVDARGNYSLVGGFDISE